MTKQPAVPSAAVTKKRARWLPPVSCWSAAFFIALFLYVGLRIEPTVQYHVLGPFSLLGDSSFAAFLDRPGGLVDCAAVLLGHLNHFNWLGALVFSGLSALLFVTTRQVVYRSTGSASWLPSVALVLLLLILRNDYSAPTLAVGLSLLHALVCVLIWSLLRSRPARPRLAAGFFLSATVFYASGSWAGLLFALLAGLMEFFHARKASAAVLALFLSLCPCVLLLLLPGASTRLLKPWDYHRLWLIALLYVLVPVAVCLTFFLARIFAAPPQPGQPPRKKLPKHAPELPRPRKPVASSAAVAIVLAAGAAAVWFTFDSQRKALAKIDYLASHGNYPEVIAAAKAARVLDFPAQVRFHRALYYSGSFLEDFFAYTNPTQHEILPGVVAGLDSCRPQSQTLLELGLVNDAEHLAHEALEIEGNRPELLLTLAQVNILKRRPNAARVFLNVLSTVPFEGATAAARLRELEMDPALDKHPETARIRSCSITNDIAHEGFPAQPMLACLLAANPQNRMAFEYLVISHLIDLNLQAIADLVPVFEGLGYKSIPRHLEEAFLLHQHLNGALIDLHGRTVSAVTRQRFEKFRDLLSRLPDQSPQSRRALAREFSDTYWLFYVVKDADSKRAQPASPAP